MKSLPCPVCGAALELALDVHDDEAELEERRQAWRDAEDAALLREASPRARQPDEEST